METFVLKLDTSFPWPARFGGVGGWLWKGHQELQSHFGDFQLAANAQEVNMNYSQPSSTAEGVKENHFGDLGMYGLWFPLRFWRTIQTSLKGLQYV